MHIQINDITYNIDELLLLEDFESPLEKEIQSFIKSWNDSSDFMIFQSSGSTGIPKKIKVLKRHLESSAKRTLDYFNIKEGIILNCLSIQHIGGAMQLIRALSQNINCHLLEAKKDPFESNTIQWDKISLLSLVPYQLTQLIENNSFPIKEVKTILLGGSSPSNQLKQKINKLNYSNIYETYGMTETLSHIAVKNIVEDNEFTCLKDVSISSDNRNCLIIQDSLLEINHLITNDIVELKSEKSFIWKGRFDNIINSASVKISPEEVELKLSSLIESPFIIYGEKNDQFGEIVCLLIEGYSITNNYLELIKESTLLSKFEIPKKINFLSEFKRTTTSKINRIETLKLL